MRTEGEMGMRVLIACEESQEVCKEFRRGGMKHIPAICKNVPEVMTNGIYKSMRFRC